MLNYDTALEMLNKYGYSSMTMHPFVYQSGDSIGVCYTYTDEDYGVLERVKICETIEELEDFLKKFQWYQQNARTYHVRMILDNYETINPKVMFLRNDKIMVEGEMFDIDNYDLRESQRVNLDDTSKVIYEAGDLLLVYDEIKGRQLQYLKNLIGLKNTLRTKYFELQKQVDLYNDVKVDRNLVLLPEVTDLGINDVEEVATKDKYNMYINAKPSYEEAVEFLKEVWNMILALELNDKYYEAQKEETDIRNEMKVVEMKTNLMLELNDDIKPLFGVDLVSKFKRINRRCKAESNSMSRDFIKEEIETVKRKYGNYDSIDILYTSDYLREAIQNTNYKDLVLKYAKGQEINHEISKRKPLNEVASSLSVQYKSKLDIKEQAILVLYNNRKFRAMFDIILNIKDFEKMSAKQIIKKLNSIKGFPKIKSECYDNVKKRIDEPINVTIKSTLFSSYDFTTFESFITSMIGELVKLKSINNKMVLNGDINMYLLMNKEKDITKKKFLMVTNDLNSLYIKAKDNGLMIGLTLLKANTPVLYSPYYLDLGDIYSKDASPQMTINEMVNFELLVELTDIIINNDPSRDHVARYYSEPIISDNISIVDDIKMASKTTFCKFAFNSNIGGVAANVAEEPVVVQTASEATAQSEAPAAESNAEVVPQEVQPNVVEEVPVASEAVPVVTEAVGDAPVADSVSETTVVSPEVKTEVTVVEEVKVEQPVAGENTISELPPAISEVKPVIEEVVSVIVPEVKEEKIPEVKKEEVALATPRDNPEVKDKTEEPNVVVEQVKEVTSVPVKEEAKVAPVADTSVLNKPVVKEEPKVVPVQEEKKAASVQAATNTVATQDVQKAVPASNTSQVKVEEKKSE